MPEGFHDVQFPVDIALGSRGGPVRRTDVVSLASGAERRTARWSASRRRFNAGYGVRSMADMHRLLAFFEAREGRRFAFRWRDPFDHRSGGATEEVTALDQPLGVGDGSTSLFQLTRRYQSGVQTTQRMIALPCSGTVRIAQDGFELSEGQDFTVNTLTGVVQITTPPASGAVLTAGFLFDIPARFDTDELILSLEPGGADIPDIPIVEVRF
ncbi:DUF2460 domain-containing protein [Parvularcula sp. LCG005]|uniref:DUF2460 domain-containing protein n=1 Tax=Parvularcula sp. LCG005 TaxID=3078805 RepID=UPI002943B18D|nr:DUF2460 domain-containing protein [Parvularcula sp. LCG005]WOI53999.1 DUF2460 domain-containing protein [Parvularcula sp. LCG005]